MLDQLAFGGMLHQLVSLGALEFRPEPLDALIERRLKDAWQHAPCPNCGEHTVQTSEKSPRIWCGNCRYTETYTLRTTFYNSELTPNEFLIAFVLYTAAHTYGFLRSLNLAGAPVHGLVDCFAVDVLRHAE